MVSDPTIFKTLSLEKAYYWARGIPPPWVGKQHTGHQQHKEISKEKKIAGPIAILDLTTHRSENT